MKVSLLQKTLESYIGDWTNITTYWGESWTWSPTITDVIGKFDSLFDVDNNDNNNYSEYKNNPKSISEILGKQSLIWKKLNNDNFISISEAIIQESNRLDSLTTQVDTDQVYDHINKLYNYLNWNDRAESTVSAELDTIYSILDWTNNREGTTVHSEILDLETRMLSIENTTIPSINGSIETINSSITTINGNHADLVSRVNQHYIDLNNLDTTLTNLINDKETALTNLINAKDEALRTIIGNIPEDSTIESELNSLSVATSNLRTDLGDKSGEKSAFELIAENSSAIDKINTSLGAIPSDKDVQSLISTNANNIQTNSASLLTISNTTIPEINQNIQTLETNLNKTLEVLGNPEEFKNEGEASVLEKIFTLIDNLNTEVLEVKKDIDNIKTVINSLHIDNDTPPFPPEEEEEETTE